jgi:NADH:ubiquinone oxidoreductase subunit 6 (subunit J)
VTVNGIGYFVFAAAAVLAALAVVAQPSLHRSAYALAGLGVSVGLLFMLLGNELLLAVEVLVYGLAVPALILVALDLTGARTRRGDRRAAAFTGWWPLALAAACGVAALLLGVFAVSGGSWTAATVGPQGSTTRQMGELIFKTYALPFGISAVLLLTALVGAVVTGRRDDLEEELEAAEEARKRREERMRRRREDRERARRAQRPATVAAGDAGEEGE